MASATKEGVANGYILSGRLQRATPPLRRLDPGTSPASCPCPSSRDQRSSFHRRFGLDPCLLRDLTLRLHEADRGAVVGAGRTTTMFANQM